MGKRLTFTDYLFTLLFIFMLVCIVGAFFYGVQVGKGQAADKYEELLLTQKGDDSSLDGYHQQHLVSFYHTVFLPYREFQKNWFETMKSIELRTHTAKPSTLLKELSVQADKQYKEIKAIQVPQNSPLLASAHKKYIQSLKLFADKTDDIKASGSEGSELMAIIDNDAYIQEAKHFALLAQYDFFAAVVKWNETIQPLPEVSLLSQDTILLDDWRQMNLNLKNSYAAKWLADHHHYGNFFPQDLVVRVDEMVSTGHAAKLNMPDIGSIAQTLVDTRAVRYGDFLESKARFYANETLPQIPFFFAQN